MTDRFGGTLITKGQVFYTFGRLDGDASLQALAVKHERAFDASSGANVEVPLIRLSTPGAGFSGLGDDARPDISDMLT